MIGLSWLLIIFRCRSCNCFSSTSIFSSFASVFGTIDDEEYCDAVVTNTSAIGDGVTIGYTGMVGKVLMEGKLVICGIDCIAWIGCATWVLATKGFEL